MPRSTIEIRTRPPGSDTTWHCWLAIGDLEGRPPYQPAKEIANVLGELYPELECALFRGGEGVEE